MLFRLLKPYLVFLLSLLIVLSLSRLGLMLWQLDRVQDTQGFAYVLFQGIRFDLMLAGMLLVLPLMISPLVAVFSKPQSGWNFILRVYLTLVFAAVVFLELSTPSFINQYDLRPNYLYVEYLKYPQEVLSTLWVGYKFQLIVSILITGLSAYGINKALKKYQPNDIKLTLPVAILASPALFLICVMAVRSTFDHRPVNPASVAFSTDPLVNTLPLSSSYSVLYAIYDQRHQDSGGFAYGEIADEKAMELVKQNMQIDPTAFVSEAIPTLHHQQAYVQRKRPLNLVIILEESLGAEFVGSLGGLPLTPNIDSLANQGIWFENMYATGTRSVRGIEAVISGFTPTTSRSVVKLNKSQRDFFTIASLLSEMNYDTSFIYGGEAHFDNMRGFFANNGFNKIYDKNDYEDPIFFGSWGASDEDLFNKAHGIFESYPEDKPFFSLVFTTSNHSPFEFPDGRIELYGSEKNTVYNTVKYTDYALGEFIKKARASRYWENTLFVVVADHNSRVRGAELVPIDHFHIPALILGADVPVTRYKPLASQIDLMPTLLSLMGVNSTHPGIGKDLARNILEHINEPGRAIMQYADTQAYMEESRVAILRKNKPIAEYVYQDNTLKPANTIDLAFEEKALASAKWPVIEYEKGLYKLHAPDKQIRVAAGLKPGDLNNASQVH